MIHLTSSGIALIPHLAAFLGGEAAFARRLPEGARAVAGWGARPSGLKARALAERAGLPCLLLEDGFLRSVDREDPPLSLLVDDLGIHFDASAPSRLERLIASPLTAAQAARARALAAAWRDAGVSKYNGARDYGGPVPDDYVLVCDQVAGDAALGGAGAAGFARMLMAALDENPGSAILVRTHPDVSGRGRRGHFDAKGSAADPRIRLIDGDCHPARLLAGARAVYTVSSQMGFEALVWGRPVRCFGMPFYAGWGLTRDALEPPRRRGQASLEQLVHAALVAFPCYVDPQTGAPCEVEDALAHLALQRRMRARFPPRVEALGFSRRKRRVLARFAAGSRIGHACGAGEVPPAATVLCWAGGGRRELPGDAELIHVEDGFLRSVGLGAGLAEPLSWVFDRCGIHYDPARPSDLENLLAEADFPPALLARAASLRRRVLAAGLSKYNLPAAPWGRPPQARRVILVPGQVEDDASLRCGAPGISTNLGMLRAVRRAAPDAWLVYRPHPDVAAGLRAPGRGEAEAAAWCDEMAADAGIAALFDAVDEVHTMTSLTGFEALLRGLPVTCYGQPFYAGWGLTVDRLALPRRVRRLTLDQLVAASLILYPVYVSRRTGFFITAEQAIEELIVWRERGSERRSAGERLLRSVFGVWRRAAILARPASAENPASSKVDYAGR